MEENKNMSEKNLKENKRKNMPMPAQPAAQEKPHKEPGMKNFSNISFLKNKRSLAFGGIAIGLIIAVTVIAVVFNIVFANLVPHNIDLTSTKEYSISDQARDFLLTMNKEVEIIGLFDEVTRNLGTPVDMVEQYVYSNIDKVMEILNQFHLTNNKVKVSYVNIEKNVLFLQNKIGKERAQDFQVGDFLVMHGDKIRRVTPEDLVHTTYYPGYGYVPYAPNYDAAFVSAIMYVTSEKEHIIGFVTDHGEYSLEETLFNPLKKELQNRAYTIENIKLATDSLEKYNIVFFLGTQQDITAEESEKLIKYLEGGGHAIFLIEAIHNGKEFENLNRVLTRYNLMLNNDVVEEDENHAFLYSYNLYEELDISGEHPLAEMDGKFLMMPETRSLTELKETRTYLKIYPIVYSSSNAKAHNYTNNKSTEGRSLLGSMVESTATPNVSKILVMGSAKFATATDVGMELMVRAINWMDKSEGGFFVPIKRSEQATLSITKAQANSLMIVVGAVILLIFAIGTFVWLRRRHL